MGSTHSIVPLKNNDDDNNRIEEQVDKLLELRPGKMIGTNDKDEDDIDERDLKHIHMNEINYIPLSIALTHIKQCQMNMINMKQRFVTGLEKLESDYKLIEEDLKNENHVLKMKYKRDIEVYQTRLNEIECRALEIRQSAINELMKLEESFEFKLNEKDRVLNCIRNQMNTEISKHLVEIESLKNSKQILNIENDNDMKVLKTRCAVLERVSKRAIHDVVQFIIIQAISASNQNNNEKNSHTNQFVNNDDSIEKLRNREQNVNEKLINSSISIVKTNKISSKNRKKTNLSTENIKENEILQKTFRDLEISKKTIERQKDELNIEAGKVKDLQIRLDEYKNKDIESVKLIHSLKSEKIKSNENEEMTVKLEEQNLRIAEKVEESNRIVVKLENELREKTKQLENIQQLSDVKFKQQIEQQNSLIQEQQTKLQESETEKLNLERSMKESLESLNQKCESKLMEIEEALNKESILRKKLQFQIEDMKGAIRVYCRCRPLSKTERDRGDIECVRFPDPFTTILEKLDSNHHQKISEKRYEFDQIFTPFLNSTQESIFEETKGLAQFAIDGYNVCIFAYGQTGSGKTFTMAGTREYPGLKPRFVNEIFKTLERSSKQFDFKVRAYMLEIYLDELIDLFWKQSTPNWKKSIEKKEQPELRVQKNGKGIVIISGAVEIEFQNAQNLLDYVALAEQHRVTGSTQMNTESSRSHLIFGIFLERIDKRTGKKFMGKMSLVDLAGSESVKKTGATKDRLKEAMSINKSLMCLGNVINKLSKNEKFIPYRDNILTKIMEDSLGNNAKTLMFVNISPSSWNYEESNSSLTYASLVKTIVNNASIDVETKEMARLKSIIKQLERKLGNAVVTDNANDEIPNDENFDALNGDHKDDSIDIDGGGSRDNVHVEQDQ